MEGMIQELALNRIVESKTNPRRIVVGPALETLIESVKQVGVIQPLLVRPIEVKMNGGTGTYDAFELVAGHRRFAAAKAAGLDSVPAMSRAMNDQEVLEIQVVENLQRADLHPLEEAEGYRQLMHLHKYDVARIAERIGRSAKYVYDRVKLLSLTKAAQKLFLEDRMTAGHAVILARLKPADQARALDLKGDADWRGRRGGPLFDEEHSLFSEEEVDALPEAIKKDPYHGMKCKSVRELQAWVDEHVRFDHTAQDLPDLFPEAHVELSRAKEEAEKVVFITRDYVIPNDARDPAQKVLTERAWQRADGEEDSKPCEHSVTGVVVIGQGRGQAFKVCTAKEKCKVHWGEWQRARAKRQKSAAKEGGNAEARQASEQRSWEEQRKKEEAEQKRRQGAVPKILEAVSAAVRKASASSTGSLAELLASSVYGRSYGAIKLSNDVPRGKTAEDLVRHLAYNVITGQTHNMVGWGWEVLRKHARAVGVDVNRILRDVAPVQTSAPVPAKKKRRRAAKRARPRGKKK